ncbi:hypothetical protein J6590_049959 [Homalodisca vitripennis]|nr:hypothetical protein J6590_049959 [Homalodisca vitripennis]
MFVVYAFTIPEIDSFIKNKTAHGPRASTFDFSSCQISRGARAASPQLLDKHGSLDDPTETATKDPQEQDTGHRRGTSVDGRSGQVSVKCSTRRSGSMKGRRSRSPIVTCDFSVRFGRCHSFPSNLPNTLHFSREASFCSIRDLPCDTYSRSIGNLNGVVT